MIFLGDSGWFCLNESVTHWTIGGQIGFVQEYVLVVIWIVKRWLEGRNSSSRTVEALKWNVFLLSVFYTALQTVEPFCQAAEKVFPNHKFRCYSIKMTVYEAHSSRWWYVLMGMNTFVSRGCRTLVLWGGRHQILCQACRSSGWRPIFLSIQHKICFISPFWRL